MCMWAAAPIETLKPYMSRQAVCRLMKMLVGEPLYTSNAPKFVEVISWNKDGETFFAAINEQEESPVVPMSDIWIDVPGEGHVAELLPSGEKLVTENRNGMTRIMLPKVDLFTMLQVK